MADQSQASLQQHCQALQRLLGEASTSLRCSGQAIAATTGQFLTAMQQNHTFFQPRYCCSHRFSSRSCKCFLFFPRCTQTKTRDFAGASRSLLSIYPSLARRMLKAARSARRNVSQVSLLSSTLQCSAWLGRSFLLSKLCICNCSLLLCSTALCTSKLFAGPEERLQQRQEEEDEESPAPENKSVAKRAPKAKPTKQPKGEATPKAVIDGDDKDTPAAVRCVLPL